MVAIVSGNSLGLDLTSLGALGGQGMWGLASQGNSGEQVYVNAATGNLVVQRQDDFLASRGLDNEAVRTYNSLGLLNDDNADNWAMGVYAQQIVLSGTLNTAGSTLTRTGRDGSVTVYAWDTSRSAYVATAGGGAHDTIFFDSAGSQYVRTDGSTRDVEKYSSTTGRLMSVTDSEGNTSNYTYTGSLLTKVVDKSGETVWYDYTGTQLTRIRVEYKNGTDASGNTVWATRSTVSYTYDTSGRLNKVTVDLTPSDGSITDGNVYTTTYTYDGTSKRIKTLTQTDGSSLSFTYVQVGADYRVASITDALGTVTTYSYDTVNRRTTVVVDSTTVGLNQTWLFDYDTNGQLTTLTSPEVAGTSLVQSFSYDASGNLVSMTNADGETTTMVYDANGNQTRVTNALGTSVNRTFDTYNQLLTETISTLAAPSLVNQGGMSIVGTDIVKTSGRDAIWDASIRSSAGLTGGASVAFKPQQTNKGFMLGLNSDPGNNHSWTSIDYAIYCTDDGKLEVRESGSANLLTTTVTYNAQDDLRVTYDGTKVTYLKNGVVFRTTTPVNVSGPLFADSSFYSVGAKIGELRFGATATTGQVPLVIETNATVTAGGTVTKTNGANGSWDSSVRSMVGYTGSARVGFKVSQLDKALMVGLSKDPAANDGYDQIDYAINCTAAGTLYLYENGQKLAWSGSAPTYAVGDTLRVVYDGTKVQYLQIRGGATTVLREVTVAITEALYLDTSFSTSGASVDNLQFGSTTLATVMAPSMESGAAVVGDTITKVGGTEGEWDTSVHSDVGYAGQVNLSFSAGQTNKAFMIGLNGSLSSNYTWTKIDRAFYCRSDGFLEIREGGSEVNKLTTAVSYTAADTLQITYDGAYVRYLKNGVELYSSAATLTGPQYLDTSLAAVGAKITNLRFGDLAKADLTSRNVYSTSIPGQVLFTISPQGRVTKYLYNSFGERSATITYPNNFYGTSGLASNAVPTVTQMNSWVTAIGDLKNTVRVDYVYDARGLLSTLKEYLATNTDGTGQTLRQTQFVYDQAGRLLQKIEAASATGGDATGSPTTVYTYDGLGRLLTATDPRGVVTTTVYSDAIQKVTLTYQSGAVQTSTYDKAGRLISVAKSGNGSTTYAYDKAGRLLMSTDPLGARTFWLYDEAGRQVAAIDASGTLTETTYDKMGRVTRVYTYATAANLSLLVSGTGTALNPKLVDVRPATLTTDTSRRNIYNDAGQLVYEVTEGGALTRHEYDGAGRLVRTERFGQTIVTSGATYATVTALLSRSGLAEGAAYDRTERFFYDADGLLVGTLDGEGYLTRITYDNAGRKVRTQRYATALDSTLRAGGGTLASLTPASSADDQTETYFYNARGQITLTVDALGYLTRNGYNDRGQLADQTRYATALGRVPSWTEDDGAIVLEIRPGGAYAREAADRYTTWRYALDGQLLNTTNYEGIKTSYAYDTAGRLITTTVGDGRTDARVTQYRLDTWGQKTATLGGAGSAKITGSMTQAQIDAVWASDGVDYTYDSMGRVASSTDANGFKTLYFYDVDGRLTHTVNARGEVQETQYNTLGQRKAVIVYGTTISITSLVGGLVPQLLLDRIAARTDKTQDSKTSYSYDNYGRLSSTISAEGAITYTHYNVFDEVSDQQVAWQAGADLNTDKRLETFTYDHRGLRTSVNRDDGGINALTSTVYDAFGRVVSTTDPRGKTSTIAYDKLGRVIRTTNPLDKSVSTAYDAFSQALTVTNELNKVTTYVYDRAARSVTMTTPEGVSVTTTNNAYGQTYSVNDGNGVIRYFLYDQDGNLTQKKVGTTVIQTDDHDAGGRLISSIDADGVLTTYNYDDVNHTLTKVVDPTDADADVELNLTTKWFYDAKGQTIKVTDARSVETTYTFDLEGHTIKQIVDSAAGLALETRWTYDAEGRVATVVDANNVTTQYTYDALGRRITEVVDPGTSHLNLTRRYTYDKNGNVLTATDRNGRVTTYGYDDTGRLTSTVDAEDNLRFTEYTASGQVFRVSRYEAPWTDPANPTTRPAASSADQVTRHWYDADDRLQYTADASGAVTQWVRDGNGNVTRIIQYADTVTFSEIGSDAVANAALDHITAIEYDSYNRETYRTDPMGSVTRSEYDLNGNLVKRTRFNNQVAAGSAGSAVVTSSNDRVERFVYDAANRQTWASDATGAVTQFAYDKLGNLTQTTRYATLAPNVSPDTVTADATNDRITSYSYDRANRRTYEVDALGYVTRFTYDDNGNVTAVRRFADKPDTRSTPGTAILNDTLDRVTTYSYDLANRLKKTTDALGAFEEYTYDGMGNRLTFKNKNGDTWTYTYDKVGRMLTEVTPQLKLWSSFINTSGTLSLLTADVDESVTTTLAYDTFGNLTSRTEATGRDEQRVTNYEYDKLNRQTKIILPNMSAYAGETAAALASNGQTSGATRVEDAASRPTIQTWYDVFGNAVASTDRVGYTSYKAYDAAGRVTFEVDALGYVTGYTRNAFGEATTVTRFSNKTTLNSTSGVNAARDITTTSVDAVVNAATVDHSADRTLTNTYDKLGRVTKVTEPSAYSYNSTTDRGTSNGKQTTTVYNAFGDVIKQGEMADVDTSTTPDTLIFQYTYQYYDLGGRKTAVADAGGYLTTLAYDSEGNLKTQVEYNTAMSVAPTTDGYTAPATHGKDRTTTWTWDKLNRKLTESKLDATVSKYNNTVLSPTLTTQSDQTLTTEYDYDAVGNLISTIDAGGGVTRTYYDALGRTRAVIAPGRSSTWDGALIRPLIEFRRDAHGNIVGQIERANSATDITAMSYTASGNTEADRWTRTLFSASGNAIRVQDAMGFQHFSSYTADGRLAKTWQTVTDNDDAKTTLYTKYDYDKLGRVTKTWTPSSVDGLATSTDYTYNAFGEVVGRGRDNGAQEYFMYDNAGRMWKTNSGDGYATVYLYDLLGRQTAEISSAGSGRSGSVDVGTATSASQAAAWSSTKRINIKYNALGHVLVREDAERTVIEGGITVRKTNTNASLVFGGERVYTGGGFGAPASYVWSSDPNVVNLSWTTLAYLGSGDVRVDLTYQSLDTTSTGGSASEQMTESQIFSGHLANTGVSLTWANGGPGGKGVSDVDKLLVYKRNTNGDWVKVLERSEDHLEDWTNVISGTQVEIGEPLDPTTQVKFLYKLQSSSTWLTLTNGQLFKFGDSRWFDANQTGLNLSGTYNYQVIFTPKDSADEVRETGTFTAKSNDTDDAQKTTNWVRPTTVFTRDRWGNALTQSDPRNTTWLTKFAYNRDNQVITETRPDPSNGNQGTGNNPTRSIYYDALGRQVAIKDELNHINGSLYDAGGNMVMEVHADDGVVTHFYDAFGQRVYSVDAVGNTATTNGSLNTNLGLYKSHTTRFDFDLLGRQTATTHGNSTTGSMNVYTVDSLTLELNTVIKKNLQETFTYDEAGRKLTQTNGADATTKYWYDRAGHIITTRRPGGQLTTATFDAAGHKLTELDANGNLATWEYSYFGQLNEHKDIGGGVYDYVYDTAGQLTNQTNVRDSVASQNLAYAYDAAGQLVKVTDSTIGQVSTTVYDLAGHHLREKVVRNGAMYQDNHLSYDILGRLIDSADDRAHLTFQYDAAGNRTRVTTHVLVAQPGDDDVETAKDSTKYYTYDAMNRQLTVDGINAAGDISNVQGHQLTYDRNGNRLTDRFWGNKVTTGTTTGGYYYDYDTDEASYTTTPVYTKTMGYTQETYTYDALNRLLYTDRDGTLVDQRRYDGASRVVQSGPSNLPTAYTDKLNEGVAPDQQIGMEIRRQRYDSNGNMKFLRVFRSDMTIKYDLAYGGVDRNNLTLGYDAVGNVLAYEFRNADGESYMNTTTITLAKFEGYVEKVTTTTSTKFQTGTSTSSYDKNGFLTDVTDSTEYTLNKQISNDAAGRVLRVYQNGNKLYNHMVNGEVLGQFGVGPNEIDPRTKKNQANFQQVAEFSFGYRSISGSYPAPSVGSYTVRQGDSLQGIAQLAFGDSTQWWRIAQANGLQGDRDLRVGQTLTLPSTVSGASNNESTFKPYNPSDVIGDTSPNLPQPKQDKGCGALGQIIMIVVAVAVTVFTAGVASMGVTAAMNAGLTGVMTAGGAALAGGSIGAAVVGAAVGSIVSQGVGIAIGAQESFSWKGVALSAISAGVTAGMGSVFGQATLANSTFTGNVITRAAMSNALTQGIGVATGLQDQFSWTGVAAAAVGAGVGAAVGGQIGKGIAGAIGNDFGAKLVTGTIAGIASGVTVAVLRGGRVSISQIAADAFGNALGNSIVGNMTGRSDATPKEAPDLSSEERLRALNNALLSEGAYLVDPEDELKGHRGTLPANTEDAVLGEGNLLGITPDRLTSSTGFAARLYHNTDNDTYTLAFRGTDSLEDFVSGNRQAFGPGAPQYEEARRLVEDLQLALGDKLTDLTGHSLGGGLAAAVSMMSGVRATTFNAAGVNPETVIAAGGTWSVDRAQQLITNFRVEDELLTSLQEYGSIGKVPLALATPLIGPSAIALQGAAILLPDAVGRQITIDAIDAQGQTMSFFERNNVLHMTPLELHGMDYVLRGMDAYSKGGK